MENSEDKMNDIDMENSVEEIINMMNKMEDAEKESSASDIVNMVNDIIGKVDRLTAYNYDETIKHEEELKILQERNSNQTGKEDKQKNLSERLKIYEGKTVGKCVLRVLDVIIENNKKEERKITVKFMEQETSVVDEINNMKNNVKDNLDDYEITYDYDENSYINKAVIEEVK